MRQVFISLQNKIQAGKVITLIKVKHGTGKHTLTIGASDRKDKEPWMIVDYNKSFKYGQHMYFASKASIAKYLIDFCGRNSICQQLYIY